MPTLSRLAALLVAGAVLSAPVLAADKGKPVATVNGQPISQSLYDAFAAEQKARGVQDTPQLHNAIKEELVRREILAQEAKKKGLDKKADYQAQVELIRQGVLINALISDYLRSHPVTDDQLKKDYEAIKTQLGSTEYKSRHVLVKTEDEAKAIIAKLDKGEKLAEIAKQQSEDPGSKDNGGDLGWSSPKSYLPPFGEALQRLKKGEYTKQPVKTEAGYHVILLEDSRPLNPPPFEQVKPQLQERAVRQQIDQLVKDLTAKAKIN